MKFGLIREGKNPPDRRVVLSPQELLTIKENHPQSTFKVQTSPHRVFTDSEYEDLGFEVSDDMTDCDVLLGVKEVPVDMLINNKTYFFFSHTVKRQPYNKKLLQACVNKNIRLIDHETLVDQNGHRLIGFGRYAGIVGAYNTLRAFGLKFDLFNLKKAEKLKTQTDLVNALKKIYFPPIKVVLTGAGKVGMGAKEILVSAHFKEVLIDDFINKDFDEPVFVQIDVQDYYKRKDNQIGSNQDFKSNPHEYESDFEKFSKVADVFIAGHFYKDGSPKILTKEMLNNAYNKVQVIGDISCDIDGPIDSTIRSSTIENPFYGYYPRLNEEVSVDHPAAIVVMAVDNLPCELPKDASEGFGKVFSDSIIPAFFNNDKEGILQRATICENGKLSNKFSYLKDYISE